MSCTIPAWSTQITGLKPAVPINANCHCQAIQVFQALYFLHKDYLTVVNVYTELNYGGWGEGGL